MTIFVLKFGGQLVHQDMATRFWTSSPGRPGFDPRTPLGMYDLMSLKLTDVFLKFQTTVRFSVWGGSWEEKLVRGEGGSRKAVVACMKSKKRVGLSQKQLYYRSSTYTHSILKLNWWDIMRQSLRSLEKKAQRSNVRLLMREKAKTAVVASTMLTLFGILFS